MGLREAMVQFLCSGALGEKYPAGFPIQIIIPFQTAHEATMMLFIQTVKEPVVSANSVSQQFCRHILIGVGGRAITVVIMLQQETRSAMGVDYRTPADHLSGGGPCQIGLIGRRTFSAVVEQASRISCLSQTDEAQAV